MPTPLPQIDSRTWEHPADRAALNTLRAIPGFDEVVRKVAAFVKERGVRQLFLANTVKVTAVSTPSSSSRQARSSSSRVTTSGAFCSPTSSATS